MRLAGKHLALGPNVPVASAARVSRMDADEVLTRLAPGAMGAPLQRKHVLATVDKYLTHADVARMHSVCVYHHSYYRQIIQHMIERNVSERVRTGCFGCYNVIAFVPSSEDLRMTILRRLL